MSDLKLPIIFILIFAFHSTFSQEFELDTREIKDLVKKWNYANNWRSEETFQSIYDEELIFYAQTLSRARCVSLKLKLFNDHPEFKQKIISDPVFTPYTSGIIKCDFEKEVYQDDVWKIYPSYLLISYEDNRYVISGESDLQTDRVLKFDLDIGEPMDIPVSEEGGFISDSTSISDSIKITGGQGSEDSTLLTEVYNEVLSDQTVTIPKKYLYFLIGFLVLTALIALFSRQGRGGKNNPMRYSNGVNGVHKESVILRGDKGFESFIVSLFDPHFFTLRTLSRQKALVGNGREHETLPHMEFEFHNKETRAIFAVECIYIPMISSIKVMTIFGQDPRRYEESGRQNGADVYIIIGVGGDSDNPKEIYLVRTNEVTSGKITYADLQPFRKYGMFFYSSATGKLQ